MICAWLYRTIHRQQTCCGQATSWRDAALLRLQTCPWEETGLLWTVYPANEVIISTCIVEYAGNFPGCRLYHFIICPACISPLEHLPVSTIPEVSADLTVVDSPLWDHPISSPRTGITEWQRGGHCWASSFE